MWASKLLTLQTTNAARRMIRLCRHTWIYWSGESWIGDVQLPRVGNSSTNYYKQPSQYQAGQQRLEHSLYPPGHHFLWLPSEDMHITELWIWTTSNFSGIHPSPWLQLDTPCWSEILWKFPYLSTRHHHNYISIPRNHYTLTIRYCYTKNSSCKYWWGERITCAPFLLLLFNNHNYLVCWLCSVVDSVSPGCCVHGCCNVKHHKHNTMQPSSSGGGARQHPLTLTSVTLCEETGQVYTIPHLRGSCHKNPATCTITGRWTSERNREYAEDVQYVLWRQPLRPQF